ncbi:putative lumazine-binding protein [compost metagenome]
MLLASILASVAVVAAPLSPALDPEAVAAVEQVARDYVDGQLEGDAARVARSIHPDLAKRAVANNGEATSREVFPLRRMSADELIELTAEGAIKTPRDSWRRSVTVLDIAGDAAVVRVETPWFVDFFHLGRFGSRWMIVNALWWPKPATAPAAQTPSN